MELKTNKSKKIIGDYELIAMMSDECYSGMLTKDDPENIKFKPMDTTVSEYYKDYYKDNIRQDSILL